VITGETTVVGGNVAVGDTITPGWLPAEVHPLTRTMTPAVTRIANKSKELFSVIVPDIKEEHDNYLVGYQVLKSGSDDPFFFFSLPVIL
jgi:hypothetical protein